MEKELFGLVGVVVGFTLKLLHDGWEKRKQRQKEQCYLAAVVTMQLESFFDNALAVCNDNGMPDERGEYHVTVSYPKFNLSHLDVDWRCLSQNLMLDILWLPEKIREATELIYSINEHVAFPPDHDELFEARQYEFAKLALTADELSSKLRKVAKLPARVIGDEFYNPRENLKELLVKIDRIRQQRETHNRKMFEGIAAQ